MGETLEGQGRPGFQARRLSCARVRAPEVHPGERIQGARLGYYFAMGKHGLGYYADDPRLYRSNQWRETWEELQAGDARARQARREETKAAREDRRDASAYDPHDYREDATGTGAGRGTGRGTGRDPYRGGGGGSGGRDGRGGGVDDRDRRDRRRSRSGSRDRGGRGSPPREMTREEKEKAALERLAAKRAGAGGLGHRSRKFGDF